MEPQQLDRICHTCGPCMYRSRLQAPHSLNGKEGIHPGPAERRGAGKEVALSMTSPGTWPKVQLTSAMRCIANLLPRFRRVDAA